MSAINQHKRIAMGEKVTGKKDGGSVKCPPPAKKSTKKSK